jgi:DNA-binding MurR/RpiR family transcriptional regulator
MRTFISNPQDMSSRICRPLDPDALLCRCDCHQHGGRQRNSSNIAVLALIEGLVAGVMARNKEAVKLATELTESVMSYLHIPSSNKSPKK